MQNLTPRLIETAESKVLGIEQGWYGVKVSGTIMTGPSSTLEKCLETIRLLPEPVVNGVGSLLPNVLPAGLVFHVAARLAIA